MSVVSVASSALAGVGRRTCASIFLSNPLRNPTRFLHVSPKRRSDQTFYTKTHEWVRKDTSDSLTVGVTQHAQEELGEIVYVDPPDIGKAVRKGEALVNIESVKAVGEVYSPLDGEVTQANSELADQPTLVNDDAENRGWLVKIRPASPDTATQDLMTKDQYQKFLEEEDS